MRPDPVHRHRLPARTLVTACTAALLAAAPASFAADEAARSPLAEALRSAEPTALARALGADERGMRRYVLVILKTGPNKLPAGAARDAMFKGHFANIERLAAEKKLVLAGPLDGVDGWRGLFVLAVSEIEEAQRLVATDPVIEQGEMVAEYHRWYGSAGVAAVNDVHRSLVGKPP